MTDKWVRVRVKVWNVRSGVHLPPLYLFVVIWFPSIIPLVPSVLSMSFFGNRNNIVSVLHKPHGYHMCLRAYLHRDGTGKGSHCQHRILVAQILHSTGITLPAPESYEHHRHASCQGANTLHISGASSAGSAITPRYLAGWVIAGVNRRDSHPTFQRQRSTKQWILLLFMFVEPNGGWEVKWVVSQLNKQKYPLPFILMNIVIDEYYYWHSLLGSIMTHETMVFPASNTPMQIVGLLHQHI